MPCSRPKSFNFTHPVKKIRSKNSKTGLLTSNSFLASGNLSLSTESTIKTTASTPEVEYSLHRRLAADQNRKKVSIIDLRFAYDKYESNLKAYPFRVHPYQTP
jgi:hypothetical protein